MKIVDYQIGVFGYCYRKLKFELSICNDRNLLKGSFYLIQSLYTMYLLDSSLTYKRCMDLFINYSILL